MKMKILNFVILPASIALLSGCALFWVGAGAAAGAGAVVYAAGELQATEEVSFETAWDASAEAMADLGFNVTKREYADNEAELTARTDNDKKVTVQLETVSPQVTEIGIRVGLTGDEALSRRILSRIRANY